MMAGRVWKFGDNINTDLMLPGPYLYRSAEEQATAVFMNNRPGWANAPQPCVRLSLSKGLSDC